LILAQACSWSEDEIHNELNEKLLLVDRSVHSLIPYQSSNVQSPPLEHQDPFSTQKPEIIKEQETLKCGVRQEAGSGVPAAYRNGFGIEKQSRSISYGYQCLLDRWRMWLRREIDEAWR